MTNSDYLNSDDNDGMWIVISYTGSKGFRVVSEQVQMFITEQFAPDEDYEEDGDDDDGGDDDPQDDDGGW